MDSYIETFEKAIKNHKNGIEDKSVPAPFLVHRSGFQPTRTEDGYAVGSTFYEQGGLNQKNINLTDSYHNSMNVHFAAQCTVSDHSFGKWAEKNYTVYAPYIPALVGNGLPETCITADTAFVSTDERVRLPGAIMVEDVPPEHLGSDFTRIAPDGHILMANRITPENKDSALSHIDSLGETSGNEKKLEPVRKYILSGENENNYPSMDTVRDVIGANRLGSVPNFFFPGVGIGSLGDYGYLDLDKHNDLADMLSKEFPDQSGFRPVTRVHKFVTGHNLRTPEFMDSTKLNEIMNNNKDHPKLREMAGKLPTSNLYQELRGKRIADSLIENDMHIKLDSGVDQHFCHFLSGNMERYKEPTLGYGMLTKDEATHIFSHHLTPDERQKVIDYAANVKNYPDGKLWEKLNKLDQDAHLQETHDKAKAFEQTLHNGMDGKAASNDSQYENEADHRLSEKETIPAKKSSTHGEIPMSTQQTAMPHSDDAIHAQLIKNNNKFDAFAASMDAFNSQPAIREAHERAAKYGMDPKASIHEALDNHPNLKASYLNLHKNFHEHIQPAMEKHMELIGQMQDPDMKNRAMKSLQGRMEHMADAQKNWPDRDSVMKTQAENKQGQQGKPGLGDIIARFLAKLKEIITGKPAQAETAKQTSDHSATAQKVGDVALAVAAPEVALAKTVVQSVGQNAQNNQAQRPGMRRK